MIINRLPRSGAVLGVVAAMSLVGVSDASAAAKRGLYEGVSSQGYGCGSDLQQPCTIAVRVTKKARWAFFEVTFVAPCENGRILRLNQGFKLRRNRLGWAFGRVEADVPAIVDVGNGNTADAVTKLDGRFPGRRFKGTLSATATVTFADDSTTPCATPPITFDIGRR
jgi:hypothetical protein